MELLIHDCSRDATQHIVRFLVLDEENYDLMWSQIYLTIRSALERCHLQSRPSPDPSRN